MKSCCADCARIACCTRQYDEEQRARCPILNDDEPLRYRNTEGYSDPTAFFALRNAMRKPKKKKKVADKPKGKKERHPRTQVVHYD